MINRGDIKLAIDMVVNAQDDQLFGGEAEYVINTLEDCGNTIAAQAAEITRLKTVPMKYRRMQFNAELQEEAAQLRQQLAAQAAVIEKLREALEYYANQDSYCNCDGCEQLRYEFGSETQHAIFALAIPTDSTQILDEVRRAERERCAKVCDEQANEWDSDAVVTFKNYAGHCAAAIRAMERMKWP